MKAKIKTEISVTCGVLYTSNWCQSLLFNPIITVVFAFKSKSFVDNKYKAQKKKTTVKHDLLGQKNAKSHDLLE